MKALAWLLGIVLVLGGLGVGAVYLLDGVIRERVEAEALAQVDGAMELEGADVAVEGFPVAWYALRREFPAVELTADAAPLELEGGRLTARDLDARLSDVVVADDAVRAASVQGTARIDYADVSALAGTPISHADGDRVRAEGSMQVLGVRVTGTITAVPVVDVATQTIRLDAPQVDVSGVRIPDQAVAALVDTVWRPTSLDLPHGLQVESVEATEQGLTVAIGGTDLALPRG